MLPRNKRPHAHVKAVKVHTNESLINAIALWRSRRLFAEASSTTPASHVDQQRTYLEAEADAYYRQGDKKGDNNALWQSIGLYRQLLSTASRERAPLQWAMTQNNLGLALETLGERESGTARLDEAVAAYHEALKERTRERAPLQWATTQYNLGLALETLGERETSTARLEQAIAAYREALSVFEPAGVTPYIEMAKGNLARAEAVLNKRKTNKQLRMAR